MPFKGVFEDNGKIVSYLDELRYFIMTRPRPAVKPEIAHSAVYEDKRRRIKIMDRRRKGFSDDGRRRH